MYRETPFAICKKSEKRLDAKLEKFLKKDLTGLLGIDCFFAKKTYRSEYEKMRLKTRFFALSTNFFFNFLKIFF